MKDEVLVAEANKKTERAPNPIAAEANEVIREGKDKRHFARAYVVALLLPIEFGVFYLLAPNTFATRSNMASLLTTNAVLLVLAAGETVVLICGEFDLSFAGIVGMSSALVVGLHGAGPWGAVGLSLAIALGAGAINALFVVGLGVNTFVVTLGMMTVTTGIGLAVTNSETLANPFPGIGTAVDSKLGGIGIAFFYGLGLIVALWFVLKWTRLGRNMYFVGAGRRAAAYAGIRVNAIRVGAFLLSAGLAWLGGIILLGQSGAEEAGYGSAFLLSVFAAVFLGCAIVQPGRFNAVGTLIGMLMLAVGTTGIEVLAAPTWATDIYSGAVLFLAVALANIVGARSGIKGLRSVVD